MVAVPWSVRARARLIAMGAALIVHGLVLMLLIWRLGAGPDLAETRSMNVVLTPLAHHRPRSADRETPPSSGTPPVSRPKDRAPEARRSSGTPPPEARSPSRHAAPQPPGPGDDVRSALRGLLGCQSPALVGLTSEERERCKEELAAGGMSGRDSRVGRLNFDRRGDFTPNPEPYLTRRPNNGCRLRAAGDIGPQGQEGVEAGVGCARPF